MSKIRDYNDWLAYSIEPRQLRTALRPAMWGNGQLELLAELDRPCVSEVVCFDFKEEGLWYSPASGGVGGEEASGAGNLRSRHRARSISSIQPLHRPPGKSL